MKSHLKRLLHGMGVPRYMFYFIGSWRFFFLDLPKFIVYTIVDAAFLFLERHTTARRYQVAYGADLRRIPYFLRRRGGDAWHGQWAYRIGLWYGIMHRFLYPKRDAVIVDVGCATGIAAISAEPFVSGGGKYIGIDIDSVNTDFCSRHYNASYFSFIHHPVYNAMYEETQPHTLVPWPIVGGCADAALALSVWTHMNERDARFYFKEIARILKPGGLAFVTFFLLDWAHEAANTAETFPLKRGSVLMHGSRDWWSILGHTVPEIAVGITEQGIRTLCADTGLFVREAFPGYWKGELGLSGQDLIIFEKR